MIIKYKLFTTAAIGQRQGIEPCLIDIDSNIQLSFFLSSARNLDGDYYAILKDNNGIETKSKIINGVCDIPQAKTRSGFVYVDVVKMDGSKVAARWDCGLIKLTTLADELKYKLTFYQSIEEVLQRLSAAETAINTLTERIAVDEATMTARATLIAELQTNYNNSITVINDINSRLKIIENE